MACGGGCFSFPCPECGATRPPPAEGSRTPRQRRRWTEEELAYDGDPNPKRLGRLTPRQRDIVTRIIGEVLYAAVLPARARYQPGDEGLRVISKDLDNLMFDFDVDGRRCGIRLDVEELETLYGARDALNPRRGD